MTHEEFTKDGKARATLEKLLTNPTFVTAIDIVKEQMRPRTGTQADAVPAMAAAKMHQVAGANEMLDKLKDLTREPKEVKQIRGRALAKTLDDLPDFKPTTES